MQYVELMETLHVFNFFAHHLRVPHLANRHEFFPLFIPQTENSDCQPFKLTVVINFN